MKPRPCSCSPAPSRSASRPSRRPRRRGSGRRSTARRCAPIRASPPPRPTGRRRRRSAPQARAGLLPNVSRCHGQRQTLQLRRDDQGRSAAVTSTAISISTPRSCRRRSRFSATRIWILYDQAKQQVTQADYVLGSAQQDLIVRVAQSRTSTSCSPSSTSSSPRARRRRSSSSSRRRSAISRSASRRSPTPTRRRRSTTRSWRRRSPCATITTTA